MAKAIRKSGRPHAGGPTPTTMITVSTELRDQLKELATEENRTMTGQLREMIREYKTRREGLLEKTRGGVTTRHG